MLPKNPMDELAQNKKLNEVKFGGKELYELRKRQKEEARGKE